MILDELVLHDVGVFAGRNTLTLTPPGPGKPVILIGGLNGAGKTTILEAIHLVLYGALAGTAARRATAYDSYLRSLIHHAARPGDGAGVELAFHAYREGAASAYRIRRYWRSTRSGTRERLEVLRDGVLDQTLTATWAEQVEAFLPRGIASLFFFDGEQIESLADLERSRHVLGSALASLLGLDLVDRLTSDLAVLRRRHRARQVPDELRNRLDETQSALMAAKAAVETAVQEEADARGKAERARKQHHELDEQYRADGGHLLDKRAAAEDAATAASKDLARIDDELREIASGSAPLLLVTGELGQLAMDARREAEATRDRLVLDVLAARDSAVLERLRQTKARTSVVSAVEDFLAGDRDARERAATSSAGAPAGLADPGPTEYLNDQMLPATRRQIRGLLTRRAKATADLDAAERLVTAIPDPEALAPLRAERDRAYDEMLRADATLAHHQDRLAALRQRRDKAQTACEKAMDDAAHASLAADDDRRLVDHADRIEATLGTLKAEATRRHLDRICVLILDALSQLMRKDNLITEISIAPESYAVEMRGAHGQALAPGQLSVGERQLLAVAMLWGLARAAGQPLPVVIDTPLGRLDSSHRYHLLDRYFPQASHQVVLLSTDTEIDAAARERLQPYIGRSYRLDFDPATSATTARPGYFWE
jgi:DNA sulfur modification protein DndD